MKRKDTYTHTYYDDHVKTTAKIVKMFVVEATITTTAKLTINSARHRHILINFYFAE